MSTSSVSISYRPVRIGFLIKDGNIEDFIKCCEINTLLWGGVYNPIIPVGNNDYLTKQFIRLFSVDILLPISNDPKTKSLINEYPYLKNPHHLSENIFYEDWHTKKQVAAFIDVIHLIDYYWKEQFKHSKDDRSNCAYINWDSKNPHVPLFTAMFGTYPKNINLKTDYDKAFKNGLRAKEVIIKDSLASDLSMKIDPIKLTAMRLSSYKGFGREEGLYIGSSKNFIDLVLFWNLRAAGMEIIFLPIDSFEQFKNFASTFINNLDERPSRHPNFEDWIGVYSLNDDKNSRRDILSNFTTKKKFMFSHLTNTIWNGLNIKPSLPEFKAKSVLSIIEKRYGRYSIVASLPKKPFIDDRASLQNYVLSIGISTEFEYPDYTLKLPYLPDLNEFYSRQVILDPWALRVEKNAIGIIEHLNRESIKLSPVPISDIMKKIFERAGLNVDISPGGRIANLIIKSMGGIEGCRVFKVKGVRKLFKEIGKGMPWVAVEKLIWQASFKIFYDLYIESRKKKNLSPPDVVHYLFKKKVLSAIPSLKYRLQCKRKEFICDNCGYKSCIRSIQFGRLWKCGFCGAEHYLPLYIRKNLRNDLRYWIIRKSGLFAKENNQEGSIPVILTLMQLNRLIEHGFDAKWITSLRLKDEKNSCEIDFAMLNLGQQFDEQELQIAIGECKENIEINDEDINNLLYIKEKLENSGLDCYLVFSKAADSFLPTEIERFRKLVTKRRIIPILFTNTELEPYEPYFFHPKEKTLPHKYAHNFTEIAENSRHIYLE